MILIVEASKEKLVTLFMTIGIILLVAFLTFLILGVLTVVSIVLFLGIIVDSITNKKEIDHGCII